MEDKQILELYFARDEGAIEAAQQSYGSYCRSIARGILGSVEDAEECVNDAMLRSWNAIPPKRPENLGTYLGRLTRNLSFDRYRASHAGRRGSGQTALALEELEDCIPDNRTPEQTVLFNALQDSINAFLRQRPKREQQIFLRRYYFADSLEEIARRFDMTENAVAVRLSRTRKALKAWLAKEEML